MKNLGQIFVSIFLAIGFFVGGYFTGDGKCPFSTCTTCVKPCEDCHCKKGGMCCCNGTCKPKCNCEKCNCGKEGKCGCVVSGPTVCNCKPGKCKCGTDNGMCPCDSKVGKCKGDGDVNIPIQCGK